MKAGKKILYLIAGAVIILFLVFSAGRYGWKVFGFSACQGAGITKVAVSDSNVQITGFYPGSFPEGFCGYYARQEGTRLYAGFRFSALFGMFETGDFSVSIPVKGEIDEVILKTAENETLIWDGKNGSSSQWQQSGVYIRVDCNDVYGLSLDYMHGLKQMKHMEYKALEDGKYVFLDHEIASACQKRDTAVPFTITAEDEDGNVLMAEEFIFDADKEKMYLQITSDGSVIQDE